MSLAPYNIERVEIIKGPNAILVPGGSPGGQMNPITKSPIMKDQASVTLVVRYNGRQKDLAYTDPSFIPVRTTLDDYMLVNLNGVVRLSANVSLTGRIENLFDEEYQELFGFRGAGRAAFVGLSARF